MIAQAQTIWTYGQDRPFTWVQVAVRSLQREGWRLREVLPTGDLANWTLPLADQLTAGECRGCVIFCDDPGLVACLANKRPGVRAAAVTTVLQAAKATLTMGANLLAVEMPGRTYYEVRQIMRELFTNQLPCPEGFARVLEDIERCASRS